MAQHDLDIANQGFASFRADLNSALQAIGSVQSGASAPSVTYPCMLWADTGTGWMRQRNAANTAWTRVALLDQLGGGLGPAGEIVWVPFSVAPSGFLKANGALLSRTTYADLWAAANGSGNIVADGSWSSRPGSFSTGDGSTTFRIPDMRGLFPRGYHDGSGTYETDTARTLGSYQADSNVSHTHGPGAGTAHVAHVGTGGSGYNSTGSAALTPAATAASGGSEARPRNAALLACIRY